MDGFEATAVDARKPLAAGHVGTPTIARRSAWLWDRSTAGRDVEVVGHMIRNVSLADATQELVSLASRGHRSRVVFVNAHVVNSAAASPHYRQIVAGAEIRLADGSGLAIAARLAGTPLADNVNGTDMLPLLAAKAKATGLRLFLLGGAPGVAQASADTLARLGHASAIAGTHHGYFLHSSEAESQAIDAINASAADILLVGMGVPIQDQWIERNFDRLAPAVSIGVGGLFDFYSGRKSRAPQLLRTLGLEWTWRLALEPRRMWRRYLIGNATFLAEALRHSALAPFRHAGGRRRPRST